MKRPAPLPTTRDLFDEAAIGESVAELQNWLEAWLGQVRDTGQLRHDSSEAVYRAMWGGLTAWCLAQQPVVRLLGLTPNDLRLFLRTRQGTAEGGELTSRYAWRLLNLVDRVLHFAARELQQPANTAAADLIATLPAVRLANVSGTALPDHLPADEARQLVVYLSSIRPRGGQGGAPHDWHMLRNGAAVALQLGAGLTPGDVRALRLTGVVEAGGRVQGLPWKLVVPADGNTPERETPVAAWAGQLLRHWLTVRAERQIPGPWVFPSTLTGKPWAKAPQYKSVAAVLQAAGLDQVKGGSFRLRHTFALRQLRRGKSPDEVARWMGIANVAEMDRYTRVLAAPVDVV